MKLNESDLEFFRSLSESNIGKKLIELFERFIDEDVADVRTFEEGEDAKSRIALIKLIRKEFIDRIKIKNESKKVEPNEYL